MSWFLLFFLSWSCVKPVQADTLFNGISVQFVANFGGKEIFRNPQALSIDPRGMLYVVDTGNHRIQKFDSKGKFLASVGGIGKGVMQFDTPVSIWAENGLDVLIADWNNHRIERYDKDLNYLGSLTSVDTWPEVFHFGFPLDVAFTSQSELFCLDGENARILKFDVYGNPQLSFGGIESGRGRLIRPQRLLISGGMVYVSDKELGQIFVFDTYGNFLYSFGSGILQAPMGLDEDGETHPLIFVADSGKRRIFVFQNNALLNSFGDEKLPGVRFGSPVDVAYWNKLLYVLDEQRAEVFVFRWIMRSGESLH